MDLMSNFSYLSKVTGSAIDQGPTPTTVKYVGGFAVEAPQRASEDWTLSAKDYEQAAARLQSRLTASGVAPLVILPNVWWDSICKESNLWQVEPDSDGFVAINAVKEAKRVSGLIAWYTLFGLCWIVGVYIMMVARSGSFTHLRFDGLDVGKVSFLVFFAGVLGGVMAAAFYAASPKFVKTHWKIFIHLLWNRPTGVLTRIMRAGKDKKERSARVALPAPSPELANVLSRVSGNLSVKLATKPGGVVIDGGAWRNLYDQLMGVGSRGSKRPTAKPFSGIVYADDYLATAILAEVGTFPIDKKIIDRVTAKRDSLRLR
jgi:hypothetical protein